MAKGEGETGEKWKFRGASRRKNASRYWSIDTLLRRLRCLRESSRRKNTPASRSGRILLGTKETPRGSLYRIPAAPPLASCSLRNFAEQLGFSKCDLNVIEWSRILCNCTVCPIRWREGKKERKRERNRERDRSRGKRREIIRLQKSGQDLI